MNRKWIILAVVFVIALLGIILWAGNRGQPQQALAVTGSAPADINEGASVSITCTATSGAGIRSVRIRKDRGNGALLGDNNPAPDTADNTYNARTSGKSHEAVFTCFAVDNNGATLGDQMNMIVRDGRDPEWDGGPPVVPVNGSDGDIVGKVGVPFDITVQAKDTAPGPGIGQPSGIYQMRLVSPPPANITIANPVHTTIGVPKGPPDNTQGPLNEAHTFTLTCIAPDGNAVVNVKVTDTVENDISVDLPVECWAPP